MAHSVTAVEAALSSLEKRELDPLAAFQWKNWAARELARNIGKNEVYWHSGNMGGKTTAGAALAVGMLRGEASLDGIPLPRVSTPATGILLVPSYKQAAGSTVQAIRRLLGRCKYKETLLPGGVVSTFHVQPKGSHAKDPNKWSTLYLFPHDGEKPSGFRADFVWADEPPPIGIWHEAMLRAEARETFVAYITATPLDRRLWEPILERFKDCLGHPVRGRLRIQSAIHDNLALSETDIKRARRAVEGDPYAQARLLGDHVDASGSCPFPHDVLTRWMERTRTPDSTLNLAIQKESDAAEGKRLVPINLKLQQWGPIEKEEVYLVVIDPAKGMNDNKHDPDGIHVWGRRSRGLVARANEYLGGWAAGMAAEKIAKLYNNATIDVLRTGGYGETIYSVLRERQYPHLTSTFTESSTRNSSGKLGFVETHDTRARMLGALEQALLTDGATIPSREVIHCLMDCVIDENGKIVAGPGRHDEDLILAGRALQIIQSRAGSLRKISIPDEATSMETFKAAWKRSCGAEFKEQRNSNQLHDSGRW